MDQSYCPPNWPARLARLLSGPDDAPEHWAAVAYAIGKLEPMVSRMVTPSIQWLLTDIQQLRPDRARAVKRLPGMIGRFPLFAAYVEDPVPSAQRTGRLAQAHLLIACAIRESSLLKNPHQNPLQTATLAVRQILEGKLRSDVLDRAMEQSLEKLCDGIEHAAHATHKLTARELGIVVNMRALMLDARDNRDDRTRTVEPGEKIASDRRMQAVESAGGSADQILEITGQLSAEHQSERTAAGLPPREDPGPTLFSATPDSRSEGVHRKHLSDHQVYARMVIRARAIKSGNQPTPIGRQRLHASALRSLEEVAASVLAHRPSEDFHPAAMLCALLLLGADPEQVGEVLIRPSLAKVPKSSSTPAVIVPSSRSIVRLVPKIPDGWTPKGSDSRFYRQADRRLVLPIPDHTAIGKLLLAYASATGAGSLMQPIPDEDTKRILKRVNSIRRTQITLNRLSTHLERSIVLQEGDYAEAELLSSRLSSQFDPRRYYYAPSDSELIGRYQAVWQSLSQNAEMDSEARTQSGRKIRNVGSRAVPTTEEARKSVQSILEATSRAMEGRPSAERIRMRHNALTAYTTWQIYWMTGMRPVIDPIVIENYNEPSGLLAVNDKDTRDEYSTRVVWLPPPVREQVAVYRGLARETAERLFNKDCEDIEFRIIAPDLELTQMNRKSPKAVLEGKYPLEENSHRHYLRTRLRELGVDAGYVDAMLGHSNVGHEPYARHSALSPPDMIAALEDPMNTIWSELGWRIIPEARR